MKQLKNKFYERYKAPQKVNYSGGDIFSLAASIYIFKIVFILVR